MRKLSASFAALVSAGAFRARPAFRLPSRFVSLAALASMLAATGASAQPADPGCAVAIDDLGAFVADVGRVLGTGSGSGDYGALAGDLDPASVKGKLGAMSREERKALAGKLLTIATDPKLGPECADAKIRYNAAMLLDAIATASQTDGTSAADKKYFLDCLLQAAEGEKDPLAKRQLAINLDRLTGSMSSAQKTRADALIDEFMPKSPHYPTVFGEDGKKDVVNVVVHTANQENRFDYYKSTFRGAKMEERGGDLFIEYKVTPDDPTGRFQPVTYKIQVKDERRGDSGNFDIFDAMDSNEPAIEVFNYHSQYGSSLTKSINAGAENPGSKKIFFLGNCKSHVNASRIEAKYPQLGSMYTIDSQYMTDTPKTLKQMLNQLPNRPTWAQINRSMAYANLILDENYLTPDDRRRLVHMDTDFDGIPDAYDTGVDCGLVDAPSVHDDFGPRTPVADASKLSGERLQYAVGAASGILGYTDLVSDLAGKFVADGVGSADPNGPRFTFTRSGDKIKVKLNAAFSHLSDSAMTAAVLREGYLFEKSKSGRTPTLDDKVMAYALGVKLLDSWTANARGDEAYEGFQNAYNLGKNLSLWDAASKIDHDRGVTKETIEYIKSKLS